MSQILGIPISMMQGMVSDALPDSPIDGSAQMISLTKQGRIRAAVVTEDLGVSFFTVEQDTCWGEGPSLIPGSPWDAW